MKCCDADEIVFLAVFIKLLKYLLRVEGVLDILVEVILGEVIVGELFILYIISIKKI